jgi:PAS domain S-box-containing protein
MARNLNRWLTIVLIIILVCGVALILWNAHSEDSRLRSDLLTKSRLVEKNINTDQVLALTGSEADLRSPDYLALKEQMVRSRTADPLVRFMYLMGQRPDGSVFFFADSEIPESENYSPPGQLYTEASGLLLDSFATGMEVTEGPLGDRWGTWVTGFVPVTDPSTGRVIAVLGMDVDGRDWNRQIATASSPAIAVLILLLILLLTFSIVQRHNLEEKKVLEESEQAIRESEARLNAIVNGSSIPQFVINKNHRIIYWNKALEVYSGIKAGDVIGTNLQWKAFYGQERPTMADLLVDGAIEKVPYWYEGKYRASKFIEGAYEATDFFKKMGKAGIWLYFTAALIRDSKGNIIGAVETLDDITERKLAEDAIQTANKKLNLLSGITRHDILNQMTAVYMMIDLAKRNFDDPEMTRTLLQVEQSMDIMRVQIEFTRDYQDLGVREPGWQDVSTLFLRVADLFRHTHIEFSFEVQGLQLYADFLLERAFYNLVDNSIMHGKHVSHIRVSCQESNDGLILVYEDNGIGIPQDQKGKIFTKGFGEHSGLGAFLIREILSITGISIRETGTEGIGARFTISVPSRKFRWTGNRTT